MVVGHSFGGAEAITFASRYADQVTGLVLIDASPATWPTELCAVADDGSGMAALVDANCAGWTDPTANVEHLDVFGSFEEVAGIASLGSLPMTVITAVDRQFADLGARRAGPPHRGVEPGPAAMGRTLDHVAGGAGREHEPRHRDRPPRRRHRRGRRTAPVASHAATQLLINPPASNSRSHHARPSHHPVPRRHPHQPSPSLAHPRSARPGAPRHLDRPHHHQRRHAPARRGSGRQLGPAAMDRRLLHDRVRRPAPHRRQHR